MIDTIIHLRDATDGVAGFAGTRSYIGQDRPSSAAPYGHACVAWPPHSLDSAEEHEKSFSAVKRHELFASLRRNRDLHDTAA